MTSRRQFLTATGAGILIAAPAILCAQTLFTRYPFSLGVTSGDPAPDGFVIWTRLAPDPLERHGGMPPYPVTVKWEVATDERFATIAASGETIARPELGHSVHVEVAGLQPDRPHWYRFILGADRSTRGRARTLPLPGAKPERLRFGVAGCQNYEDGHYTAYRSLARQGDLAFCYHYGDFLYEYTRRGPNYDKAGQPMPLARTNVTPDCFDLSDYRLRYTQYLSDLDLQAARMAHSWLPTFDDHEVQNNWAGPNDALGGPTDAFLLRRQAAFQAWYEFMPVRASMMPRGPAISMYRQIRYGDLAAIDLLDTRQYRTDQPCGDDFKPACPGMTDPKAHMISDEEEAWLAANLWRRDTAWNCVAQQVMMMALDRRWMADATEPIYNMDSWAGYRAPRDRLLRRMKGLGNVVVLTGDEHQNYAGLLDDGERPVAVEFVSTSISSGGDGSDQRIGSDVMLRNNPQLKFINDQRGYLVCDVTRDAWAAEFMVADRVSTPGGTVTKRATATVARGEVAVRMG